MLVKVTQCLFDAQCSKVFTDLTISTMCVSSPGESLKSISILFVNLCNANVLSLGGLITMYNCVQLSYGISVFAIPSFV